MNLLKHKFVTMIFTIASQKDKSSPDFSYLFIKQNTSLDRFSYLKEWNFSY